MTYHIAFEPIRNLHLIVLLPVLITGCSTVRVDARMDYWKSETTAHLPIGSSKQQAVDFFASRGLALGCCMSQPPGPAYHLAYERNVGRILWTEYDVVVLVRISAEDKVSEIKVQSWGIGF